MKKKAKSKKKNAQRAGASHAHRGKTSPKFTLGQARNLLGFGGKKKGKKKKGSSARRSSMNPFSTTISLNRPARVAAAGVGVLVGVAGVKAIAAALPASITSNNLYVTLAEFVIAGGLWWGAGMIDAEFGAAVGLGGIAEAASTGLNSWLPSVGSKIALNGRGTGDFVRGKFAVPQNPVIDAATGMSKRVASTVSAYPRPYAVAQGG